MLLNRPKNINVAGMAIAAAEAYINANYDVYGKLAYENVNGTCIVNCGGDVEVKNKKIGKLTDGFEWGIVKGYFTCEFCSSLKSLEGAPKEVNDFYCCFCASLTSIEGAPKKVGELFDCSHCENLTSLKGAPKEVSGTFNCACCKNLKSLKGAPEKVGGDFKCTDCENLTSLEGAPKGYKIYCDERLKK